MATPRQRPGPVRRPHPRRRAVLAVVLALAAVFAALVAPAAVRSSTAAELRAFARLDAAGMEAMVRAQPERLFELANAAAGETAREWPALPRDQRAQLERLLPAFIGNLDGVPYSTRDRANRHALQQSLTSARARAASAADGTADRLSLAAYTAIHAALSPKSRPARHLVEFVAGARPTAAISVGDVGTAAMVTWLVPGMGTYTTDMQLWTLAAQNVWDAQRVAGAPANHAVIAWMGYVVPPVGVDAALGEYAAAGAPLLTEAIQGVRAVRRAHIPTLNVVAHSYGTTMSADALADTPMGINAFVMLGSAGIEETIPTAAALHAKAVYAGEAVTDDEADLGRVSRTDPREPAFGARVMPVDGDPAQGLLPVTGHAPILHSSYNDDIASPVWTAIPSLAAREAAYRRHLSEHGYLDAGTQSLAEVGRATATVLTSGPRRTVRADDRGSNALALPTWPPRTMKD